MDNYWCLEARQRLSRLMLKLFPGWYCGRCRRFSLTVKNRRMNTMYPDDRHNWTITCADCYEEIEDDWAAAWYEYYAGRL